ncbi:hypothetical protein BCR42DRAFT_494013 [Absidia repens]|uniref:Kinetochore protein Sos7 coiled-coil domain-containing protein n=1 Tax=Absidia repens TaxID=90262 RepID=A0A1X2I8G1_9FUNG|nr:hypothetical protein BCR42DRAFT_494013 [Absidia repens]
MENIRLNSNHLFRYRKVTDDTTSLSLHLTTWQKDYKEKLGLLSSEHATSNDTNADETILPLHPKQLELEIARYQDHINELKYQYVQLATKHQFLLALLQDPPRDVRSDQVRKLETVVLEQSAELGILLKDLTKLKHIIAEGNATNEKARQQLKESGDEMIKLIDEIEDQKQSLASLTLQIEQYKKKRTPEEAKAILEQQTRTLAEINKTTDHQRDAIMEMEWQLDDRLQEVQALEATLRQAEAKAKEAVEKSGQRDLVVEQQEAWYREMAQFCHSSFGIHKVDVAIDLIQVEFARGHVLSIHVDPLTERITDISVNNEDDSMEYEDLKTLAEGQLVKEIASTVVLETLARIRQS